MKILIVHQYFKTPKEGGGIRSWHISNALRNAGHDVTVLSGHNELNQSVNYDGIEVCYFKIPYDNSFGFVKRVLAFLLFVRNCYSFLKQNRNFELGYVLTTPLTTGFIALRLKKYSIPYVFEVGDLWPEVPVKLGLIKNKLLVKLLYNFESNVYRKATKLVGLSPPIANYMKNAAPGVPVHVATNVADTKWVGEIVPFNTHFSKETPLKIHYYGALGYANEVNFFLDAAQECLHRKLPVSFTVMGFGAQYQEIKNRAMLLENVVWEEPAGMNSVRKLIKEGDATYISYRKNDILNTGSPNKFFDGIAAGHLIVLNFGGWIAELIEQNDCGFHYDPDHPSGFAEKIEYYLKNPAAFKAARLNSRKLAELQFEKDKVLHELVSFLSKE